MTKKKEITMKDVEEFMKNETKRLEEQAEKLDVPPTPPQTPREWSEEKLNVIHRPTNPNYEFCMVCKRALMKNFFTKFYTVYQDGCVCNKCEKEKRLRGQ